MGQEVEFEVDTGAGENFLGIENWRKLGSPGMKQCTNVFGSAMQHRLSIKGFLHTVVNNEQKLEFFETEVPHLNLLGRSAIRQLDISVDKLVKPVNAIKSVKTEIPGAKLLSSLKKLCEDYAEIFIFKSGLGLLKDFELDVKFKDNAKPVFMKPLPVPFAVQEKLNEAYDAGIKKEVWKETQFSLYGTPVLPIRKKCVRRFQGIKH